MEKIDLKLLENYHQGMKLKDKRGGIWCIDFVGNFEISLTNVKTGLDKEVTIDKIVTNYTIIE